MRATRRTMLTLVCILAGACARGESAPPEHAEAPPRPQPNYEVFAPLKTILAEGKAPMLLAGAQAVVETPCVTGPEASIATAPPEVANHIKTFEPEIQEAWRTWLRDKVAPTSLDYSASETVRIGIADVVVQEIEPSGLRFAEDQACIREDTRWLDDDVRLVTGLFGAKTFNFSAPVPIDRAVADGMREEFKAAGFSFETSDLIDYEALMDDDGNPQKGDDGAELFRAPDGTVMSKNKIVPPETQKLRNWTAKTAEPVFFAFREIPATAVTKENNGDRCNVNLVWDDPTGRSPECDEFGAGSFSASKKAGEVELRVTLGGTKKTEVMAFGEERTFPVGDQTLLWLSVHEIEEGTLVKLDSLSLGSPPAATP